MVRERGLAYCGLACCLCGSRADCPGCREEGCEARGWCKNFNCCREKRLSGCWECEAFPCEDSMLDKLKPRAFSKFVRQYGEEMLLDCLEKNEKAGVIYHIPGSITGEYDAVGSEEAVFELLLRGGAKK